MIKVKDGYGKLIDTAYLGSGSKILKSDGGDVEYSTTSSASTLVQRNASGLIESNLATGTSPFKVTSTTVVSNLNADLLDGVHKGDLFTNLSSASKKDDAEKTNNLSITVGGTTRTIPYLHSTYLSVQDIRDTSPTPNDYCSKRVSSWFNNTDKPTTNILWYSGISVAGWTTGYRVWLLASNSTTGADGNLYHRGGLNETWEAWRTILDSVNYTNYFKNYYNSSTKRDPNTVLAGPSSGTTTAEATFRKLVAADIPNLDTSKLTSGVLSVARGGTGQNTLVNAANSLLNSLSTGSSNPVDDDYYISLYSGGGTTNTIYYRRPVKYLYNYIKGKLDSVYLPLSGGTVTDELILNNSYNSADRTAKGLVIRRATSNTESVRIYTNDYGSVFEVNQDEATCGIKFDLRSNATEKPDSTTASNSSITFENASGVSIITADKFTGSLVGNAATATKLATARTIWGLSFDGTSNVDGKLTITSGGMQVTGNAYFGGGTTYYFGSTGSVNCHALTSNNTATFKNNTVLNNNTDPYLTFKDTAASQEMGKIYYTTSYDSDNKKYKTGCFLLRLWSYTADTATKLNYYESYLLPNVTTGLTSSKSYYILTSKNYSNYLGYIGTTAVLSSSKEQALTGITSITASGNYSSTSTTDTNHRSVKVGNKNGEIALHAATNRGLLDNTTGTWVIGTNGTNTWTQQGNFGIGTTAPSQKLEVSGNVKATKFINASNSSSKLLRSDGGDANFNWSGQSGLPKWLWGGDSQHNYYVYNPSNFSVKYATSSGKASIASKLTSNFGFGGDLNAGKYFYVGSFKAKSSWEGYHSVWVFTGTEASWGGILDISFRAGSSATALGNANIEWLSLTYPIFNDSIYLTYDDTTEEKTTTNDDGETETTVIDVRNYNIYIKIPANYKSTLVTTIYETTNLTYSKTLVDSYKGTLYKQSSGSTAGSLDNHIVSKPSEAYWLEKLSWYNRLNNTSGYAGDNTGFPTSDNANGILWLSTYGTYGHLLGFSGNGRIYQRYIAKGSFPTTANGGSWNKLAWVSDIPTNYVTIDTTQTISGAKTFTATTNTFGGGDSATYLTVDRNSTNPAYVCFKKNGNLVGYLGVSNDKVPVFNDGNGPKTILHSGNYVDYVTTTNFPGLNKTGTVTSITPGTGLTNGTEETAITTSGTLNLKTASTSEIGGVKIAKDNSSYTVTTATSSISANVTSGKYYGVEIDKNDKAFVYVPWADTTYTLSGELSGNTFVSTLTPSTGSATTSTVPAMSAATDSAAGKAGLVPAPAANKHTSFLRGDGTWAVPTNTDTKVTNTLSTATKFYFAGTTSTSTATGTQYFDTNIYTSTTAGALHAKTFRRYDGGTTNSTPLLHAASNNTDITILRASYAASEGFYNNASYGFSLNYIGTGGGNANYLKLLADNQTSSTQALALCVDLLGNIGIGVENSTHKLLIAGKLGISMHDYTHDLYGDENGNLIILGSEGIILDNTVTSNYDIQPYLNNLNTLGTSTLKWKNVYSTKFNDYELGAACAKSVSDSSSASAISTGTNLVTERDVYYGLPKINNSHSYTSSTSIYAPTAGGTSGYYLKGNGTTSTPVWQLYSSTPTSGSTTLITSGGVYTALEDYLPLEGGTITGLVTFGANNFAKTIKFANTDYSGATAMIFMAGGNDFCIRHTLTSDKSTTDLRFNGTRLLYKGNILPYATATYTLGDNSYRFKTGYFSDTLIVGETGMTGSTSGYTGCTFGSAGNMELVGLTGTSGPKIDFHYNKSTSDFTTRIIENAIGLLHVYGNLYVHPYTSASGTTTSYPSAAPFYINSEGAYWTSDRRFKKNIQSPIKSELLEDETGFIRKFDWKETGKPSYGYIAQELLQQIPEAVDYDDKLNKYSVNYNVAHSAAIAQLVIKVKELESEIIRLKLLIN